MINTQPAAGQAGDGDDTAVQAIVQRGPTGARMLAGIATAVVIGLWCAFYLLIFVPRSVSP